MRLSRVALLGALVVLFASPVWADTVAPGDPQIIILSFPQDSGTIHVTGLMLPGFTVPGGAILQNNSGVNWFNLGFIINPGGQITETNPFSFTSNLFASCVVTQNGSAPNTTSSVPTIVLCSGGTGIPNLSEFTITMPVGTSTTPGWLSGTTVQAAANVPEPATLGLFLTGVGALVARRRLRKAHLA